MLRLKLFFSICRQKFIVDNLFSVYTLSTKILTTKGTNNLIGWLYGDILLGGTNIDEFEHAVKKVNDEGVIVISGYIREGLTKEEENHAIQEVNDAHIRSIDIVHSTNPGNFIAIKVSCFCNKNSLGNLNKVQRDLIAIENYLHNNKGNRLSASEVSKLLGVKAAKDNLTNDLLNEISEVLFKDAKAKFTLNIFEHILKGEDAKVNTLKKLFGDLLNEDLIKYVRVINERLDNVISHASKKKVSILMDAEETYYQNIIDALIMHYFKIYNKDHCLLLHTLQCYLKSEPGNLKDFISFIRAHDLKFGLKLVKGAYLKIETKMATSENRENPVNNTIDDTQNQYNASVDEIIKIVRQDEKVIFATHNFSTIEKVCDIMSKREDIHKNIWVAQLLGMSEHASLYSKKFNVQSCKYVPFGSQHIMIPYLVRRAEESAIVRNLNIQTDYLHEEFKRRFGRI